MLARRRLASLALLGSLACDPQVERPSSEAEVEPAPAKVELEPTPEVEPAPTTVEPEPAPEVEPAPPPPVAFDPATVTSVHAKIVAIPYRKSWVPCGVIHSVGVLEVEVLDVGEPPPRLILFVSCPVDQQRSVREKLVVGATITVTLHARKQSWTSVAGLPDLPRRYVKSFVDVSEAEPPPG